MIKQICGYLSAGVARRPGFLMHHWGVSIAIGALLSCLGSLLAAEVSPLATLQYRIVGTQMRITPASVSVPKGIPGSILPQIVNGDGSTNGVDPSLASGAYVEAVLRGPSFSAMRLVGQPGAALMLPPISLVGDYQLDGIRLVDAATGATRLEGLPASVPVHVFDQVLISSVTSRPLSMQEITDRGIVLDANNFRAVEFEVGFVLDGQTISIKLPVVAPDFQQSTELIPRAELESRLAAAQQANDQLSQQLTESANFPPELQRPGLNIQIKGANFQLAGDDDPQDLRLSIPPIPALLVIPGNVGYLNQFFSVQIFTENGAPLDSGLSVFNVMAKLNLPPGPDGILSTNYGSPGDDPLRLARVGPNAQTSDTLQLFGPAPKKAGRFFPGESGSAEFLVEGLQEGLQVMNLDLTADLDGLAAGTVHIKGTAAGSVLVRNPKFSLSFIHPKTIRGGEPYTAYVTILNTGGTEANLLSVTLRGASISGGVLQSAESVQLGTLAPGQSATANFRILAQRTGSIKFSNITTGDNSVQGRFSLTMGIDERGVELSPDTIGMPDFVNSLPPAVLDAANRVLGQALSAATAPLLPPGVKPVSRATITRHVLELAEAGQRLKYLESMSRVLPDLFLDWQGGRLGNDFQQQQLKLTESALNEAATAPLLDEGFDQIIRSTDAGRQFRSALLQTAEANDKLDDTARLVDRAADLAGRGESWLLASSSDSAVDTGASGPAGVATTDRSDLLGVAAYPGLRGSWLAAHAATNLIHWTVKTNLATADLAVVALGTNGIGVQWRWTVTGLSAGACLSFDPSAPTNTLIVDNHCDGTADARLTATMTTVRESPPQVLTVIQDIDVYLSRPARRCTPGPANNYGQVLGVLFSKPMLQTNAAIPAAYQLDNGNSASGVQMQPGGRVALISMREGVSAIRARSLTVTGVTDQHGNLSVAAPMPVLTDFRDGVAVNGRVLRADGTAAAGVPVTVTMYDPWRDPFDRCEPIIVTRTEQKYTDTNGLFTFDFIHAGVSFTIAAVDTGGLTVAAIQTILGSYVGDRFAAEKLAALAAATNAVAALGATSLVAATRFVEGLDRAVWGDLIEYGGGRMGHEMVVGLRFRGRAEVTGTVLDADGATPVPNAAVNLFPAPDSREQGRGVFSDQNGRFDFNGVPLGQYTVNVKTSLGHFRTVVGNLVQNHETNDLTIVLTAPDPHEIVRTSVSGRVVEADNITGHSQAKVFVSSFVFGLVGALTADNDGYWQLNDIPAGDLRVTAFSRDFRRRGDSIGLAVTNSVAFLLTSLAGTGSVVGRVETSAGLPVANAIVAGGEALVRTDTNGFFRLTGVPQGQQRISAGLEAKYAPGGFPRIANATATVLPDIDNFVVIRLPAVGQIIGQLTDANGTPIPGNPLSMNVAIPIPSAGGFLWVTPDQEGKFQFPNLALGDYVLSAPAPPVDQDTEQIIDQAMGGTDDQIAAALQDAVTTISQVILRRLGDGPAVSPGSFGWTTASIRYDGDTAIANIQYLPEGKVNGTVLNDQGVPIGAAVRLTGPGLDGIGQPSTLILGNRTSDPATGQFSFFRLPQGSWALQAASPFYPVVVFTNGGTTRLALDLTNVVLQFPPQRDYNGRLAGNVLLPDGSPAGAGVNVHISFSSDYVIRTDTNGYFDTQIKIPASTYTVEADDPATGLRGQAQAKVSAGVTNFSTVQLLGKGALQLTVLQANGSPATNASVRVTQSTFPGDIYNGVTDMHGRYFLDNLFQGKYGLNVVLLTGAARLEGNVGLAVAVGTTNSASLTLGPTGTIRGVFINRDDGSPVVAAKVSVGDAAFPTTDNNGTFQVSGMALGSYRIVAQEPVSGRWASASATLAYDGQVVNVSLTQLSQGELRGTVFQVRQPGAIAGATVAYSRADNLTPTVTVTTGPDGVYSIPAVMPGPFNLMVTKYYSLSEGYSRAINGTYPDGAPSLSVDVTLPGRTIYGRVTVQVYESNGITPATNAVVNQYYSTDANGRVVFDNLKLGPYGFVSQSTLTNQSSSGGLVTAQLTELQTNVAVAITLSGVGRIHGRVLKSDGVTPDFGAEIKALAIRADFNISRKATAISDTNGEFVLEDFPLSGFQVTAVDGALASSTSGNITHAGQTAEALLQLGASGSVVGRLLRTDGVTAVPGNPVELTFTAPSKLDGIALTQTDGQGRFQFEAIPAGPVNFTAAKLDVNGLAKVHSLIASNGQILNLGDILLHEDWPMVSVVVPDTGAQGVSTTTRVDITFSEPIQTNSIFPNGIYLHGPTTNVPANLSWDAPTNSEGGVWTVRLSPKAPLESQTIYRLFVLNGTVSDGLSGILGQGPVSLVDRPLLAVFSSSFTTRDDIPPWLISIFPTNGAYQIDPLAVMRLSFSEPLSLPKLSATLTGPNGTVGGAVNLGFNGTVLTFTPNQPLAINTTYTLNIDGVQDLSDNVMTNLPIVATFNTLDTIGPTIATLHLANNQLPVAGAPAQLEAILDTPEPGASVRFTANLNPIGQVTNTPFLLPVKLPSTGAVTYRAIATDRFGNDGPLAEFTVATVADQPPIVTLSRGTPGDAPVPTGSNFVIHIAATSVVGVTNLGLLITGPTNVTRNLPDGSARDLVFTLPSTAVAGTPIQIRARASDVLGLDSADAVLIWPVTDATPPILTWLSPAAESTLNLKQPLTLQVVTSDNSTNAHARVVTRGGLASTNDFDLALAPNTLTTNTLLVSLANAVQTGGDLFVTLMISDAATNQVALQRHYTLPDITPPRLLSVNPTNGAVLLPLWDVFREFNFSKPLAGASVSTNFFAVTNNTGTVTPYSLQDGGNTVRVNFGSPLQPGAVYTNLVLPGITDQSGNPLVDASGNPLPNGANFTFATAGILNVFPTNGTSVQGGDLVRVGVTFDPELGARYFAIALNGGVPVTVPLNLGSNTNVVADIPIPLDTSNLVVGIQASDDSNFTRPYFLNPIILQFAGNRVTNPPPVVTLTGMAPSGALVGSGSNFVVSVSAAGNLPVTNVTVTVSGPTNSVLNFPDGNSRTLPFTVPAKALAGDTVQVSARAIDALGLVSPDAVVSWTVIDGTPPTLAILSPADSAVLIPNQPLNLVVLTSDNSTNIQMQLVLSGGVSSTQTVAVALTPNTAATNTISASLAGALTTGVSLTATITATDAATNTTTLSRAFMLPDTTPPQLVSVTPANGAVRQSLWLNGPVFQFSEAMAPGSLSTNNLLFTNNAGIPTAYQVNLEAGNTVARLLPAWPLRPGVGYTGTVLPGPTDRAGNTLVDATGNAIPAQGLNFAFTTAAITSVTPANGAQVIAGQSVNLAVSFESGFGAGYFRFVLNNGSPLDVSVAPDATNVTTVLLIPPDATHADISILASDTSAFLTPYSVTNLSLQLQPANLVQVTLSAPATVTLIEGLSSNVLIGATSDSLPLAALGFSSTNPAPSFASLTGLQITNTATNGNASAQLLLNPVYGDAGTYLLTLLATATNGAFGTTNILVTIAANPTFVSTHWKDPVSGNWSDTNRWTDGLPGINRPAAIDASGTYTVNFDVDATVGGLSLGASSGTQTLAINGHTLTLNTPSGVRSNGVLLLTGGTITGNGLLSVAGNVNWTGGAFTGTNELDLQPAATLTISGNSDKNLTRILNNQGTVLWTGGRIFGNGAAVNNKAGGLFAVQCDQPFYDGVFNNAGIWRKTAGTGTTTFQNTFGTSGSFNNHGLVDLQSGILDLSYGGAHTNASFTLAANTTLVFHNGSQVLDQATRLSGQGLVVFAGGTVTLAGPFDSNLGANVNGATVNFDQASLTLSNLTLSAGTVSGSALLVITNSMNWSGGTLAGPTNSVTIGSGATLTISGPSDKTTSGVLNNQSTVLWTGGRIFGNGATVNNQPGGVFEAQCDQLFYDIVFNNEGTWRKTAGTGTTTFQTAFGSNGRFNNGGVVDLRSGTLDLFLGGTHTNASFTLAANTTLIFHNGVHTLDQSSHINGPGQVVFAGATVTVNGDFETSSAVNVIAGAVTFNEPASTLQDLNVSGGAANFNQTSLTLSNLTLSAGTVGGAASLVVTNSMSWSGGTLAGTTNALDILAGATLTISGTSDKAISRIVNNQGTVLWTSGRIFANGAVVNNLAGGLFAVQCDQSFYDGVFNNAGIWRKSAGTGATILQNAFGSTGSFNNAGLLDLQSGTLDLSFGGAHTNGTFTVAANTTLLFHNGTQSLDPETRVTGQGLVVFAGGTVSLAGPVDPGLGINLNGGVAYFNQPTLTLANLTFSQGTLGGTASLVITNSMIWSNGTLAGTTNGLTVVAGATLTISGTGDKTLSGNLSNQGTILWTGGRLFANGAVVNNQIGAIFAVQCDQPFYDGEFNNAGIWRKTSGTGTTIFQNAFGSNGRFNNSGLVDLQSGTLDFSYGGAHTNGSFILATNTTLVFHNGTQILDSTTSLSGQGLVVFAGGSVTLAGLFDAGIGVNVSGGTANFNQTSLTLANVVLSAGTVGGTASLVVTNTMSWSGGTIAGTTNGLTVAASATLTISGANDRTLAWILNNQGTILWTGGRIFANGAVVNNEAGGLFAVQCDQPFYDGVFNNAGIWRKTVSPGITTYQNVFGSNGSFNNHGLVDLESGSLALSFASANSGGSFTVATNTVLAMASGTHSFTNGCAFSGSGTVRVQTPMALGQDLSFGQLNVIFEASSSVTGTYTISNAATGLILIAKNITLPGSIDIGGTLQLTNNTITFQISGTLTLEAGGTLINSGTIKVSAFVNQGGTLTGNPPVVGPFVLVRLRMVRASENLPAGEKTASAPEASNQFVLQWSTAPSQSYVIESSIDLSHWSTSSLPVFEIAPNQYEVLLNPTPERAFFRLRLR